MTFILLNHYRNQVLLSIHHIWNYYAVIVNLTHLVLSSYLNTLMSDTDPDYHQHTFHQHTLHQHTLHQHTLHRLALSSSVILTSEGTSPGSVQQYDICCTSCYTPDSCTSRVFSHISNISSVLTHSYHFHRSKGSDFVVSSPCTSSEYEQQSLQLQSTFCVVRQQSQ